MIERGEELRFALETGAAIAVARKDVGQHLQRDVTIQPGIAGPITSPIPPAPMGASTSYGPSRDPVVSAIGRLTCANIRGVRTGLTLTRPGLVSERPPRCRASHTSHRRRQPRQ